MSKEKKEISVGTKFKIKVGTTELEMNKEEAEQLYNALFQALGKKVDVITVPYVIEKVVPYRPLVWYPDWTWKENTIYCSSSDDSNYTSVSYMASSSVGVEVIE